MPIQSINPLSRSERQPSGNRESLTREVLKNEGLAQTIVAGIQLYKQKMERELKKQPDADQRSIGNALKPLALLTIGLNRLDSQPKRYDKGTQRKNGAQVGEILFGDKAQRGKEVPQFRVKVTDFTTASGRTDSRYAAMDVTKQAKTDNHAYSLEVTSLKCGRDARDDLYNIEESGIEIMLSTAGEVVGFRGIATTGYLPHYTEEFELSEGHFAALPIIDEETLSKIQEITF